MKFLKILGILAVVLGVIGLIGSVTARQVYGSRSQLIQRVTVVDPDLAALTGEATTPIGEPQVLIIEDEGAFVQGTGPNGARLADDAYLKQKGIYPLQLKTVHYVSDMVNMVAAVSVIIGGMLLFLVKRRPAKGGSKATSPLTEEP